MVVIEVQNVLPLCVCNIYMPSRNSKGNSRSDDNFQSCLDQIEEVVNSYNSTHAILIVGDFNASLKQRTGNAQDRLLIDFVRKIILGASSLVLQLFTTPIRLIVPKLTMYCSISRESRL